MKLFAFTASAVLAARSNPHQITLPDFDWHGGEYGDLRVQPWQVPFLVKLGYREENLVIDNNAPSSMPKKVSRGLVTWANLWQGQVDDSDGRYLVPYTLDDTVPAEHHQQIHDELDDFSLAMGCLKFVHDPAQSYANGVWVVGETSAGSGCWSYVGQCSSCQADYDQIPHGWQALRLPNWCVTIGGVHHEFLHAIGYLHEQDRPDYADWISDREGAGDIDISAWIDTGHPFEPASNVMYTGFTLLSGKSYDPHPLLTTTDAEQGWDLYCKDNKALTHPMEPKTRCLHGDEVGVIRPLFEHKLCDGFNDCLDGEDEDGRLATCEEGPKTELGCCAEISSYWSGAKCVANGLVNGKDRYSCNDGRELRWESCCGWFYASEEGGWGSFASGTPEHDATCIGEHGEFKNDYPWNGYNLLLNCKKGDAPGVPTACANHDCSDDKYCSLDDSDARGYECICREEGTCETTTEPPTTTEEPSTCGCDPACTDGYECMDGECVDIDECAEGTDYCHSFEQCVNLPGKFRCDPGEVSCDSFPNAAWKGRKNTKYIYKNEKSALLQTKFRVKNSPVNPRTDLYQGFIVWTKDVCGNDFLKKLRSGEVGVELIDSEDVYDLNFKYFKNDGRWSLGGFSFESTQVVTKDTPWAFKSGVPTKNMGSDDVQIMLTGLDKVNFLDAKGMDWCLLTLGNALMPAGDYADHLTQCVFENKKFWNAPANPN